jgi:hypothetical protein
VDDNGSGIAISGAAASPPHAQHREVSIYLICNLLWQKATHSHLIFPVDGSCELRQSETKEILGRNSPILAISGSASSPQQTNNGLIQSHRKCF